MGSWKNPVYEIWDIKFAKRLAKALGITYYELTCCDYDIDDMDASQGNLLFLTVQFKEESPKYILDKIEGIDEDLTVHVSTANFEDEDDAFFQFQYQAITSTKDYYNNFLNSVHYLSELNKEVIGLKKLDNILKRQIFISIIGTMEAVLSEILINHLVENDTYFRIFVKTFPDFQSEKIRKSDIITEYEKLKETVVKVLLDKTYHNIPKTKEMFEATFNIEFPDYSKLYKFILTRHDLVHRNGYTKDKVEIIITREINNDVRDTVIDFVNNIASKLHLISFEN